MFESGLILTLQRCVTPASRSKSYIWAERFEVSKVITWCYFITTNQQFVSTCYIYRRYMPLCSYIWSECLLVLQKFLPWEWNNVWLWWSCSWRKRSERIGSYPRKQLKISDIHQQFRFGRIHQRPFASWIHSRRWRIFLWARYRFSLQKLHIWVLEAVFRLSLKETLFSDWE